MTFIAQNIASADLYSENFNHFFTEKLINMSSQQKSMLTMDLTYKIFKYGEEASAERLNFTEKMWMLESVFNCNVTIVIDDKDNGIEPADFKKAAQANRGKAGNGEVIEDLKIKSGFVLAGQQLMAALIYQAYLCNTGVYRLYHAIATGSNHKRNQKFVEQKADFNATLTFLTNYEANKRRITTDYGLTMPEWYALLYFSTEERFLNDFTKKDFVQSYNSNHANLFKGVQRIHSLGYIEKRRTKNRDKYFITGRGLDLLWRIFTNLLLKV